MRRLLVAATTVVALAACGGGDRAELDLEMYERRDDLGRAATIAWVLVVLVVPSLGVLAHHVTGRSPRLPGWLRATVVAGGALLGGIV